MYLNKKNDFYHGVMFHHFHDDILHKPSQGSISKDDLYKLVKFIGRKNILNAEEFYNRFKEKKLAQNDVCFTFDDGIKSQFDVALPVLEDLKIKSFFFPCSSIFGKNPDLLEVYRYFRTNYFKSINDFYNQFYKNLDKDINIFFKKNEKVIDNIKIKIPQYSIDDIKFRLVRDKLLNKEEYKNAMFKMFEEKKFNYKNYFEILFLSNKDLKKIKDLGHLIGLHSHTHPNLIEDLSYDEQLDEYEKNISVLCQILHIKKNQIKYMAHPSGSYNKDTIKILIKLGVELGFKQIMIVETEKGMKEINNSSLEIARQDHSVIMKMIK